MIKPRKGALDVAAFMTRLDHPHKTAIQRLRLAIKAIDPAISEEIKWNAPSFKLGDHFATFKLYPPENIQLVLHTGAKPAVSPKEFRLDDPHQLLKWPAKDRCVITLHSAEQAEEMEATVVAMVQQWIAQLQSCVDQ